MNNENKNFKEKYEEFHKNAGIQTKIIESNNFTYHIVLSFIDKYLQPGMKVLDIGCGVGTISLYIAKKGNEVLGIDISEKAINAAQKSAEVLDIKNVSFKAIDFFNEDFYEKYDFIIFNYVIEHLPDDESAIQKIYKLLEMNGILFLSTCLESDPLHRLEIMFFGKDEDDIRVGHLRRYSKYGLNQLLKSNSFDIVEMCGTEGFFRRFLFATKIGNRLLRFVNLYVIKKMTLLIDDLSKYIFGPTLIIIIAQAKKVKGD